MRTGSVSSAMRRIGNEIAAISPEFARSALAFPRLVTQWTTIFFRRLFRPQSIVAVMASSVFFLVAMLLVIGIISLIDNIPTNKTIFAVFSNAKDLLYETIEAFKIDADSTALFWIALVCLVVIILLPRSVYIIFIIVKTLLKFFIYVLPMFSLTWLVFVMTGREIGLFKSFNSFVTSGPSESPTPEPAPREENPVKGSTSKEPTPTQAPTVRSVPPEQGPQPADAESSPVKDSQPMKPNNSSRTSGSETAAKTEPELVREPSDTHEQLETIHSQMQLRLEGLLRDFRSREETNLGIGMLLSVIGVVILLALVIFSGSRPDFLQWFIPRLSVALFIQLFAYFFLRLYRTNLLDIKYFNNELTNIEYKKLATNIAMKLDRGGDRPLDKSYVALMSKLCLELLKSERNFILKRGETTINMKEAESAISGDVNFNKQTIKAFEDLASAIRPKL
jgi:hypothetical protein